MASDINKEDVIAYLLSKNYDRRIGKLNLSVDPPKEGMFHTRKRETVVPPDYEWVEQITETLFRVLDGGKCGIFDTETGEVTWREE